MRNVSAEYLEAIRARTRVDRLTGTIKLVEGTEVPLNESNISSGGVSITRECVTGEELEFGSVILSQLNLSIRTKQSRYAFYNAKANLVYSIKLADDAWYSVELGEFKIAEAEKRGPVVQLTGYDALLSLDKDYDGTQLYGTPFEVLADIAEICGLIFNMTEEEILAFPNGDQSITIDSTSGCSTYRDCIRVVAQMLAAFAAADTSGGLVLKQFGKTPATTLTAANRYPPTIADFICRYAGLVVRSNKGQFAAYDTSVSEGLEMTMESPAWDYGTEEALQQRTQAVLDELAQIQYTPCNFEMPGDPAIECGDLIELPTTDGTVVTLVTNMTWKYKGRTSIESAGKNPYLQSVKPKQSQIIRELQTQATANKLIFYSFTNTSDVVAEGTEVKPLASVTFVTVEDTSAMFLAQLPVTAAAKDVVITTEEEKAVTVKDATGAEAKILDANGNPLTLTVVTANTDTRPGEVDLQIFYYMNGSLVEYQLIERLTAGPHILSLFYPFAELKGNTSNKFEVRILATGGSITVSKRDFRATVTGQGLSATTVWDGTLSFEGVVPAISLQSKLTLVDTTEEVYTKTQVPAPADFVQTVAAISLRSRLTLGNFSERVSTAEIRQKKTIDTVEWDYTNRYVEIVGSEVIARVEWKYESAEQTIDSGRMTVVKAVTNDLVSVEEVTVDG